MVKQVYICDRCGKMEFRSAFTDANVLPKHWKRISGDSAKVSTYAHLCEECSYAFENVFLWQESDKRDDVMQATGLSFDNDD